MMVSNTRRVIRSAVALVLVASGLALAACNTVEGVGEDLQSAGGAVSDAAR